jgi:hypothetical protein
MFVKLFQRFSLESQKEFLKVLFIDSSHQLKLMVKKHSQRFVQENQRGGFTPVPKVSSQ